MQSKPLKRWVQTLGPGLITAALVFGPSKLTITSKLGAEYGFGLLVESFLRQNQELIAK